MLLDSNVSLEVELAQKRALACRRLLGKVRDGAVKAAITDFHVDSVASVMENYGKGWKELALFFASLLRYKGLMVYPLGMGSRMKATSLMRNHGLDFDDALAIRALEELSMDTIVSYDEDLDSVPWVKRKVPEELT